MPKEFRNCPLPRLQVLYNALRKCEKNHCIETSERHLTGNEEYVYNHVIVDSD